MHRQIQRTTSKFTALVLLTAGMIGCGTASDAGQLRQINNPELAAWYQEFQAYCVAFKGKECPLEKNTVYTIRLAEPEELDSTNTKVQAVGVCRRELVKAGGTALEYRHTVLVSAALPTEYRRWTLFHELGHCLLRLPDLWDRTKVMHSTIDNDCMNNHKPEQQCVKEMFQ